MVDSNSKRSNISAYVIADSVSPDGVRITTFELEYPRFIHAEFMTHRLLSRNAQSSRAVPTEKMLELVRTFPARPEFWGKNQPGMQAKEEHDEPFYLDYGNGTRVKVDRLQMWKEAAASASQWAESFLEAGYHKQIVNRILEPFAPIKVVASATEWDNFFHLRLHEDAQPEIRILAEKMWDAMKESNPRVLGHNSWHVPYYKDGYLEFENHDHWDKELEDALAISASCCAQVSYRKLDDSIEKARKVLDRLVTSKPIHASPLEHQATPINYTGSEEGITHQRIDGSLWSGNFRGWIQNRQLIEGEAVW